MLTNSGIQTFPEMPPVSKKYSLQQKIGPLTYHEPTNLRTSCFHPLVHRELENLFGPILSKKMFYTVDLKQLEVQIPKDFSMFRNSNRKCHYRMQSIHLCDLAKRLVFFLHVLFDTLF